MRPPARASLGVASFASVASLVAATCSGSAEPDVTVAAVAPATAYNQDEVAIAITGGPFRPAYDIEIDTGQATTQLGAFSAFLTPDTGDGPRVAVQRLRWVSTSELAAVVPKAVASGVYDVEVRDPRGHVAILPQGFRSLGPDTTPPLITISQPTNGTVVIAGAEVPVALHVTDEPGHLASVWWRVSSADGPPVSGTCPLAPGGLGQTCRFNFPAPKLALLGQPLNVNISAKDTAGNPAEAVVTLAVGVAPVVTKVSPLEGPAVGGTPLVVAGERFIPGTELLVDGVRALLRVDVSDDAHTLHGYTPPHEPGRVFVSVRTGSIEVKAASFLYVGRPTVLAVSPVHGPPAGGSRVVVVGKDFREGITRIIFKTEAEVGVELRCPIHVSANRIEGYAPPGAGAVSILASDPVSGDHALPLAYTYLEDDSSDAGTLAAPPCLRGDGGAP